MINTLVDRPILLIFVVLGFGAALGAVKVKGISLGPAGALFAGLALSAIDERLAIAEVVGTLGLALFTYTIGLSSGPAFFSSLRSQLGTIVAVIGALVVAAGASRLIGKVFSFDVGVTAGLFAGSLTNTPALAAAREALDGSTAPVVGYSVAYPIGVLAMILVAAVALRLGRRTPNDDDRYAPANLASITFRVRAGVCLAFTDVMDRFAGRAVFARVERAGEQLIPSGGFELHEGDLVSVTAPRTLVPELAELLGDETSRQLSADRSRLDMRRIVVSDRRLTGRRLVDLDLHGQFGAIATRLRRGDVDLLAHDDITLLPGDRLRIVAPRERIGDITRFLGDSERRVAEIDAVGFMVGIALGLALGVVSVPLLGTGHFALGTAGGPLIVGLIVGRLERTGPIVWQPPYGSNLALRQLGTILFLGTVGSRSGRALKDALGSQQGAKLAIGAVIVVGLTAGFMLVVGRRILRLGGSRLAGTMAGLETQPAVLAFVNEQTADDRVGTAYALAFPVAMLVKIILAQLIVLL